MTIAFYTVDGISVSGRLFALYVTSRPAALSFSTLMRIPVQQHERDPNFPTRVMGMSRRYLEDPVAREQLYEDIKIEAALVKIVCFSISLPFLNRCIDGLNCRRTRRTRRSGPYFRIMTTRA